ncbi:MAG: glycyl-radical enzyme activating protein [Desulfobacterales bacterium]|nr:glycyl-radical enzyme activating protein [Desulfobacterales bacterium]
MKPIFRIQRYSVHDGPGIRTTLFFQGCPLACAWCHNPESQAMAPKLESRDIEAQLARLMVEIEKDVIFFDESGGGVTFSGGEPLVQAELLMALVSACREREIHTCLDTSGFGPKQALIQAARAVDLVLYDLKLMDDSSHEKFTRVSNARILGNLKALSDLGDVAVKLRFPMIPGITDSNENIGAMMDFLRDQTRFREIYILPFHNIAQNKYRQLNMDYDLEALSPPDPGDVAALRQRFETQGFTTHIGG